MSRRSSKSEGGRRKARAGMTPRKLCAWRGPHRFAAFAGGVLMTSDKLDDLSERRATLFADLLRGSVKGCRFPDLGGDSRVIEQVVLGADGTQSVNLFNPTAMPVADGRHSVRLLPFQSVTPV